MKYKKYTYILLLILMLTVGINKAYADYNTCYYASDDNQLKITLRIGSGNAKKEELARATIWKIGNELPFTTHFVKNWYKEVDGVEGIHISRYDATYHTNMNCPKHIVYTVCPILLGLGKNHTVLATNSVLEAEKAVNNSATCWHSGYTTETTRDKFLGEFEEEGLIKKDESIGEYTCEEMKNTLFGTKSNPTQLREYIDKGLLYVRIIVPILIIALGMLDLGKAVVAGKEDDMKKAQITFIKRLIAGVIVFFIPTFVDIIMYLAEIVWQDKGYVPCDLLK